jgi:hypothetical protein
MFIKHLLTTLFICFSSFAIAQDMQLPELFEQRISNQQINSFNGVTYINNPWVTLTTDESHPNNSVIENGDVLEVTLEVTHDSTHSTADGINLWVAFSPLQAFNFDGLESVDANCGDLSIITCQDHPNGLFAYLPYSDNDFCYSFSIPITCLADTTTLTLGYVVQFTENGSVIDYTYEDNFLHYDLLPCNECDDIQEPTITINGNEVSVLSNDSSVAGFDVGYILDGDTTYFVTGTNPVQFPIPVGEEVEILVLSYLPGPGGEGVTCYYSEYLLAEGTTSLTPLLTEEILIYPNPTSGPITISGSEIIKKITIFDSFGKLLHYGDFKRNMDLSTWGSGLRLLTITGESSATTIKVMVH